MIIGVQVSESLFSITVGIKLGVEMLGQVVILFNFLRSHQRVLHSSCTILQFHPHPTVPIPPPPPPPIIIIIIIIIVILEGVKCFFTFLRLGSPSIV